MAPLFEFDPTSESASNSPLEIWNTADYTVAAFSSPTPPLKAQWASSADTEGGVLAGTPMHENRAINITAEVASVTGLRNLQAKLGKIIREGGTAKLTFPNSEVMIFDLYTVDSYDPQLDIVYYVNSGAFCTVQFSLIAAPYGRGAELSLTLSAATATAKAPHVFTATGLKGDMLALGKLTIGNVTNQKYAFTWGVQSRYYDAAATAALFIEAEGCLLTDGTLNAGPAGASGGGANKVVRTTSIGTTGTKVPFSLTVSGANPTHVGTFRVLARVQVAATNTGTVSVRWAWRTSTAASSTEVDNDWVTVTDGIGAPVEGVWVILDLGLVTIPVTPLGTQYWQGFPNVKSTVGTDQIDIDWIGLVPADEGYGRGDCQAVPIGSGTSTPFAATDEVVVMHNRVLRHDVLAAVYRGVARYAGDYLRLPPAGPEARTLRVFCMLAGDAGTNYTETLMDATNIDATTATLSYTPRYLVVPSP